jgi:hypothetical protein
MSYALWTTESLVRQLERIAGVPTWHGEEEAIRNELARR